MWRIASKKSAMAEVLPRRLSGLYAKTFFFDYSFNYKRIVQDEKIYLYHFVLIYVCT